MEVQAFAEFPAELDRLRGERRALRDRQVIADLIAAYGPAVDRGDSPRARYPVGRGQQL